MENTREQKETRDVMGEDNNQLIFPSTCTLFRIHWVHFISNKFVTNDGTTDDLSHSYQHDRDKTILMKWFRRMCV